MRDAGELRVRGHQRSAALTSSLPRALPRLGIPFSPGFVFALRKSERPMNATNG